MSAHIASSTSGYSGMATSVITASGSGGGVVNTTPSPPPDRPSSRSTVLETSTSMTRKSSESESSEGDPLGGPGQSGSPAPVLTTLSRMAEISGGEAEDGWRPGAAPGQTGQSQGGSGYYDHPLTAATTAMLNISEVPEASLSSIMYDYYKDKNLVDWNTGAGSGGGVVVTTSGSKSANGVSEVGVAEVGGLAGMGIGVGVGSLGPSGAELSLFLGESAHGSGSSSIGSSGATTNGNTITIKPEPQDLTSVCANKRDHRGLSRLFLHQQQHRLHLVNGVLSNGDSGHGQLDDSPPPRNLHDRSGVSVKREPGSPSARGTPRSGSATPTSTPTPTPTPVGSNSSSGEDDKGSAMSSSVQSYPSHLFATLASVPPPPPPPPQTSFDAAAQYANVHSASAAAVAAAAAAAAANAAAYSVSQPSLSRSNGPVYSTASDVTYFREYFPGPGTPNESQYGAVRQPLYSDGQDGAGAFVERYMRPSAATSTGPSTATTYKSSTAGLTVDLPSPDSGIGAEAITPRDQTGIQHPFDYEMCQPQIGPVLIEPGLGGGNRTPTGTPTTPSRSTRPWHDFGRQNDADKVQIPKVFSNYGFKYFLESPISTSQRREDDRITYINKGQFYGITLEYIPDPEKPIKSQTVKSVVMLVFREEKSPEDEIKAWQFWHGRQHSVKQRILDADTKNAVGIVGGIEEIAHNAIAIYWNPLESAAKINVAVQCLSTDFSSQKGVKGLPLHLQIDTYEDPRDSSPVFHRGYCQIKVFCDKGAERKTRDEERRAAKRKMTATGRKKLDELYHPPCERSEFYAMSDLLKPPVLFTPAEDLDKLSSMDLQGFYNHDADNSNLTSEEMGSATHLPITNKTSTFALPPAKSPAVVTTLKFHNNFPPDNPGEKKESLDGSGLGSDSVFSPPSIKRSKLVPPCSERIMVYVRQDADKVFTPLHLVPPNTLGLLTAIESKYKISASSIKNLFRQNRKGVVAKIDDEMLKHYCNEDIFGLEVKTVEGEDGYYDLTLVELDD